MILILTNQYEQNIAPIIDELNNFGAKFLRLNTDNVSDDQIVMNQNGDFTLNGIHSSKIKVVWERKSAQATLLKNRNSYKNLINSEKKYVFDYLAYVLRDRYWMNPLDAQDKVHNSLVQTNIAHELGLLPPDSIITNTKSAAKMFWDKHNGQLITKTMCQGTSPELAGKMINTSKVECFDLCDNDEFSPSPILFQELIPKELEIRANYVAGEIISGAIEIRKSMIDERSQYDSAPMMAYELPQDITEQLIKLNQKLGLEFSASDIILDKNGNYRFLECNPSGQWDWLSSKLHLGINRKIAKALYEKTK